MAEDTNGTSATLKRVALLTLSGFGAVLAFGIAVGILSGHAKHGDGTMSTALIASLVGAAAFGVLCLFGFYRALRSVWPARGTASPRDRRNSITLTISGVIGAVIGVGLVLSEPSTHMSILGSGPISVHAAVVLALLVGVLTPAISLYWHLRVVDEQEAAAYSKGTLLAMYAFWIGAPVWWLLWRGGLVPAPDGIAIYFITIIIAGAVWAREKYR